MAGSYSSNKNIPSDDESRSNVIYNPPKNTLNFLENVRHISNDFTSSTPSHYHHKLYMMDNTNNDKLIKAMQMYGLLKKRLIGLTQMHEEAIKAGKPSQINYFAEIRKTHFTSLKAHWKPFAATTKQYRKHIANGTGTLGSKISFKIDTTNTHLLADGCIRLKLKNMQANSATNKCKYASRLAERIVAKMEFKCNDKTNQSYDGMGMNLYYSNILPNSKKIAWNRAITDNDTYIGLLNENPAATTDDVEQSVILNTGANVYKNKHTEVEILIPLLFWWNNDRTPLPVRRYSSQIFTIELTTAAPNECRRIINYDDGSNTFPSDQEAYLTEPTLEAEMYLGHINGTPDIEEAIYGSTEAQLVRFTKQSRVSTASNEATVKLPGVGGLVERIIVGFRPHVNTLSTNEISYTNWYKCASLTTSSFETPTYNGTTIEYTPVLYHVESLPINTYQFMLKGGPITEELPLKLEEYKAIFQHRDSHINEQSTIIDLDFRVGADDGNLFQPTGYMNIPSGNEFSIKYTGTNISVTNPCYVEVLTVNLGYMVFDHESQQLVLKYLL